MDKFTIPPHSRFLKAWLIALACHTGQLLSQYNENYSGATPAYSFNQYSQDPSYNQSTEKRGNEELAPQQPAQEQIQPLLHFDHSSSWNSNNSENFTGSTEEQFAPTNGYWPVYTRNDWDLNQSSFEDKEEAYPTRLDHLAPEPSTPTQLHDSHSHSNSPAEEFSQYPRPEKPGADRENFTHFDLLNQNDRKNLTPFPTTTSEISETVNPIIQNLPNDEAPLAELDPKELPRSSIKETAHENTELEYIPPIIFPSIPAAALPDEKLQEEHAPGSVESTSNREKSDKNLEKLSEASEIKSLPTLLDGKGNAKFVKKRVDPTPLSAADRLKEALEQAEEVIGKSIPHEHEIGMIDEIDGTVPLKEEYVDHLAKEDDRTLPNPPLLNETDSQSKNKQEENNQNSQIADLSSIKSSAPATQEIQNRASHQKIIPPTPSNELVDQSGRYNQGSEKKEVSINFDNVGMIEYIRFISRLSNKNFIFDDEDLQFNVTIVSEEPTTVENLMTALLQELRIRDLSLMEQGNNIIIHRNPRVRSPSRIVAEDNRIVNGNDSELVTRVFRLNTLDPVKASDIIRPLLSDDALIEVLKDSNNLIITDLVANINKISQLIGTLDAPNSGITIGQFVVRNAFVDSLVDLANKILLPIAQGNPFVLVPHAVSNSIFVVSNSFIVEKALAILQNLDNNEGKTKIFSLETLHPSYEPVEEGGSLGDGGRNNRPGMGPGGGTGALPGVFGAGGIITPGGLGSSQGFGPGGQYPNAEGIPESFPLGSLSTEGKIAPPPPPPSLGFNPGGIATEGRPSAIFDEARNFLPGGISSSSRWSRELPVGHIERTMFFIYKLRYRKGDNIEIALRKIANSLQMTGTANADLISAINSSQWIESSNALIFTGSPLALEKVRELILEIDVPLRQVFIEMLILDTTIRDSLSYSVDWINRFGGGTTTGEEGFIRSAPGSGIVSTDQFLSKSETILSNGSVVPPAAASPLPVATGFLNSGGFVAGVIGTHLTHNGTQFSSIGALVRAIHSDAKADIILNPKIITEDNNPAEIFVGGTDRYKTQSITNELGSLVTNNFQFIDVGTTLRVTPLIGNNGIITLEIVQETTNEATTANTGGDNQDVNLVPVLTKTRTVTKVHVPNGFFVVLSGMIKDSEVRSYSRIPCLGGIPILGCFGKSQTNSDDKRNLMLFIRPLILDTDDDYEDITKRQQDVFREKSKFRRSWNYEVDEGLSFANIRPLDPDDMNCQCSDREQP